MTTTTIATVSTFSVLLAVVMLVGKLGDSLGPLFISSHPIQLLILNANDIHCLGTALLVEPKTWFVTCAVRRMIEDPLFYAFGYQHGEQAVEYLSLYVPAIHKAKSIIRKVSYFAVMLDPGMVVCLFAGCMKMSPYLFWSLNFTGTALRLLGIYHLAQSFPDHINSALMVIKDYQIVVALFLCGYVAIRVVLEYPAVINLVLGRGNRKVREADK